MALNAFLDLTHHYPEALSPDIVFKLSSFLAHAPHFKNDILLAQASNWPAADPPLFLPPSVANALSRLCEIDKNSMDTLWLYLKDIVWGYDMKKKTIEERLKSCRKDGYFGYLSLLLF
jgi:hypothetical protein